MVRVREDSVAEMELKDVKVQRERKVFAPFGVFTAVMTLL